MPNDRKTFIDHRAGNETHDANEAKGQHGVNAGSHD